MKKLKNNWFSAGMALAMMWGIGLGMLPEKARANVGGKVYCYSASSGSNKGAGFYLCGPCDWVDDKVPMGNTLICTPSGG